MSRNSIIAVALCAVLSVSASYADTAKSALPTKPAASCAMPATASSKTAATKAKVAGQPKDVKCAVTGSDIGAPSLAADNIVYKGHTYYFCCPSCKPEFKANPTKYAKPAVAYPLVPAKPTAKPKS